MDCVKLAFLTLPTAQLAADKGTTTAIYGDKGVMPLGTCPIRRAVTQAGTRQRIVEWLHALSTAKSQPGILHCSHSEHISSRVA